MIREEVFLKDLPDQVKLNLKQPVMSLNHKFRFGLATDSHYSLKNNLDGKNYRDSLVKMKEFIEVMNEEKPDFIIHLGDFKDEDIEPDSENTLSYLDEIENEFVRFCGPRYHCIGNHDLDSITKKQFLARIDNSNINWDLSYYSFVSMNFNCLVLDANFDESGTSHFFKNGGDWQHPEIPQKQCDWLREELTKSEMPCIVFCHHPLYPFSKNGNIYHVKNYREIRKILEDSGKVISVFNGHIHEEMFQVIKNIPYLGMNSMLEGSFEERNCFYLVEYDHEKLIIERFNRKQKK